ncbi:MAG: hypothetical protein ABJA67_16200 [Chthonomonadales bacterium]
MPDAIIPLSTLTDWEAKQVKTAAKNRKASATNELALLIQGGLNIPSNRVQAAAETILQAKPAGSSDIYIATIVCRLLPPDSPSADAVCKKIAELIAGITSAEAKSGCTTGIVELIFAFIPGSNGPFTSSKSGNAPYYAQSCLRVVNALRSENSTGAFIKIYSASLAGAVKNFAEEINQAVPDWMNLLATKKVRELNSIEAKTLVRSLNWSTPTTANKVIILQTLATVGNESTLAILKELVDPKKLAPEVASQYEKTIAALGG